MRGLIVWVLVGSLVAPAAARPKDGLEDGCEISGVGALAVSSNVDAVTVFVDGKPARVAGSGTATIVLPQGTHRLRVEAEGYASAKSTVEITTCEVTKEMLILDRAVAPPGRPRNPWKIVFGVSLGVEVGLMVLSTVSIAKMRSEVESITATKPDPNDVVTDEDCGDSTVMNDTGGHFATACRWRSRGRFAMYATIGVGAFVIVSAYYAFRDPPSSKVVGVTPIVSPEMAGAQISIDW